MITLLRALVIVGATEVLIGTAIYLSQSGWRGRGRAGWFLALLGVSLVYLLVLSVINWLFDLPNSLWVPGLIGLDVALGLQLSLLLRRRLKPEEERR